MTPWRRRVGTVAALGLGLAIGRAGCALKPPSLRVAPEWLTLAGVTVVNPGGDRRENQTVVMRDGRIESIRDGTPDAPVRLRARAYEHRYVLPGLIDMNVQVPSLGHLQRLFGVLFLYAGVTTVRDVGNLDGGLAELQRATAADEFPWPRLIACGHVLEGDPPACRGSRVVRDAADARRAVDELAAVGAGCVAVRRTLSAEALASVRAAAAARGLPLVGDLPPGVGLAESGLSDVDLIGAVPASPPARRLGDVLRAWQGLDAAALDTLVASAAASGAAFTPRLQRWNQLTMSPAALRQTPLIEFMPRFYRDVMWPSDMAATSAAIDDPTGAAGAPPVDVGRALAAMHTAVRRLHDAGVRIHLGSATPSPYVMPGVGLWLEMQRLIWAGLPLEDAWVAATRGAGESLGVPQLGRLEDGAPADLLIFRQDPTRDFAAMMSLEAVVSRGRLYPRTLLSGYFLEHARYVRGVLYDRLSMLVVRWMAWLGRDLHSACESR